MLMVVLTGGCLPEAGGERDSKDWCWSCWSIIRVTVAGSMANRSKFIAGITGGWHYAYRRLLGFWTCFHGFFDFHHTQSLKHSSLGAFAILHYFDIINVVHEGGWDCSVGTVLFADIFCNSNRKTDFVKVN